MNRYPESPGYKDDGTSKRAADEIAPSAKTIRDAAYKAICEAGGLTADETAERIGVDFMSVRPRLTELKEQGLLIKTDETRPNLRSGKQASVYRITGLDEHRRLTAAREAYRRDRAGSKPERFNSWPEWWESKYGQGETFDQYVRRKRDEKAKG
jgi:hypothetical protein